MEQSFHFLESPNNGRKDSDLMENLYINNTECFTIVISSDQYDDCLSFCISSNAHIGLKKIIIKLLLKNEYYLEII